MNNFDTAAAEWDSHPHRVALARLVGEMILKTGRLTPEVRLLDYGCGTGLLGLYLLSHVKHVTGIDTSPGMLDVLQEKIVQSQIPNMEVSLLDLQDQAVSLSSFEKSGKFEKSKKSEKCDANSFDAVTMNMVLHHVRETGPLLRNLKTLLSPGGTLFITDLDIEPGTFHGEEAEGVFHHGFDREELSEQLADAGFTLLEIRTAHTMEKEHADGTTGNYDIFLAVAEA